MAAQPILLGRLWIRQSDQQRRKLTKAGVELSRTVWRGSGEVMPRKAWLATGGRPGSSSAACSLLAVPNPFLQLSKAPGQDG